MSGFPYIRTLALLFLFSCGIVFDNSVLHAAKKKMDNSYRIKQWHYTSYSVYADTIPVDTNYLNLPMRNIQNDYALSYSFNGNVVSPILSRVYFNRLHTIEDLFGTQYQPYILTPTDVFFFNTTIPYSKIGYQRGFTQYHAEYDLDFLFTANLSKKFNLGIALKYLNGAGHYAIQEGKLFRGCVMGSYDGNNYFIHTAVTWNKLSNFENGGIQNDSDLTTKLKPEDIAVQLNAMSGYQYRSCFVNHGYSITTTKTHKDSTEIIDKYGNKDIRDTLIVEYIPVTTFAHTFELNSSVHRYIEKKPYQNFYTDVFRNAQQTKDSTNVLTIKNTLSVTFEEAFNKLFRFGLTAYVRNETQQYTTKANKISPTDNISELHNIEDFSITPVTMMDSAMKHKWLNNLFVGGSIFKRLGDKIHYNVSGDVCLQGYKIGQFDLNADLNIKLPIHNASVFVDVNAFVKYTQPQYFYQQYESNHFRWQNKFSKTLSYFIGGTVSLPTQWVKPKINIGFENNNNFIYFDENASPTQKKGNAYVFSTNVDLDFITPYINLENKVYYQTSSNEIPLPQIILYHNLYYHGTWFKALDIQIGTDLNYFTRYYAPVLCPAIGQFCLQRQQKIGNYPFVNVYINFFVKLLHLKFYVQYTHINHLFMKSSSHYLAMPNYPMNPDIFRLGILWHFYK